MIQAELILDGAGLLRSCLVKGHAGAGRAGNDIVCAAVSVLTRTILLVLHQRKDIIFRAIPEQGNFLMEVLNCDPGGRDFLAGAGSFLIEGLLSVQSEFPGFCNVTIERRNSYGT